MGREEFLSKLNMRDYSNKLEKIIDKKAFSMDTKNLLLNMFYKMESAYEDYNRVKVDTMAKRDMLEEMLGIIETDCKFIELAKPTQSKKEILEQRKNVAVQKERKVVSYPNERDLIHAIYSIKRSKFEVLSKYNITKNGIENLLNSGNNDNNSEIIRDFDGWSWNVAISDIEDLNLNLVYQNIQMLVRQ